MMKLSDLGFDQWFQSHISGLRQEGRDIARISAVDRGSYHIRNQTKEVPAELTGMLDRLISHVVSDAQVSLSRNAPKTMREVKQLGDTAAHDRTYITPQIDIDDLKARYRRLIQELLGKAGIAK
jgi:hypothetical protein